jgi:ADP-ribosylglycohydrolase
MLPARDARIRGSLLGLAWGDVLGCPIEFWDARLIAQVYDRYLDLPRAYPLERIPKEPRIRGHLRPLGMHSDDTQQALALVQISKSEEPFRVDRWAACLVEGQARGAWRGTGRFFREAVARLASGVPPTRAGSPSAGIGAAMRIAPLGALHRDDPARLADVAFECSCVTHADVRAASLAFAVATCCRLLIDGTPAEAVMRRLPALVRQVETSWPSRFSAWRADFDHLHAVSDALGAIFTENHAGLEPMQRAIVAAAAPSLDPEARAKASVNDPFVLLGGVHALAVGLWAEGTPGELLATVMRAGGDTDTVGAIAGALLGARFGEAWVPVHRLREGDRLGRYAACLVDGPAPESLDDYFAREAACTTEEAAFVEALARSVD